MTEPTDDELDAVIAKYRTRIYPQDMHPRFERAIMRAAIAKWGVLRAENIVIPTDTMEQEFQKHYQRGYEAGKKAATPQPTQAQSGAVPLTDEQRNAIYDKHCFLGDNGWEIDWWKVIDEVEAAHGITGGQHGAK